jgi:hypothetical protein
MNPEARKKGGFMFSKLGRPAGGAGVNKPGKKQGKKAFFSQGGVTTVAERERMYMDPTKLEDEDKAKAEAPKAEAPKAEAPKSKELSQADIDKMSYGEAFKYFRAKGAGTKFTYKGNQQAAYRSGEEPESWKKKAEAPKPKAKPAMPSAKPPTSRFTEEQLSASERAFRDRGRSATKPKAEAAKPAMPSAKPPTSRFTEEQLSASERAFRNRGRSATKMAEGGSVESKKMMKKGGMACGGKMKYAEGGAIKKPYKPSAGDLNEKAGGDQEMEMRESMRKKSQSATPAPKPKMYARGGGIESKGKGAGTMIRMASGGSVSSRADGVAVKGKTNCKIC